MFDVKVLEHNSGFDHLETATAVLPATWLVTLSSKLQWRKKNKTSQTSISQNPVLSETNWSNAGRKKPSSVLFKEDICCSSHNLHVRGTRSSSDWAQVRAILRGLICPSLKRPSLSTGWAMHSLERKQNLIRRYRHIIITWMLTFGSCSRKIVLQGILVVFGHLLGIRKAAVAQQVLNSKPFRFQNVVLTLLRHSLWVSYAQGAPRTLSNAFHSAAAARPCGSVSTLKVVAAARPCGSVSTLKVSNSCMVQCSAWYNAQWLLDLPPAMSESRACATERRLGCGSDLCKHLLRNTFQEIFIYVIATGLHLPSRVAAGWPASLSTNWHSKFDIPSKGLKVYPWWGK